MELLQPFPLPVPISGDGCSGFSSPANSRRGFDRTSLSVPELSGTDKVYVAVGKSMEKSVSLLRWAFRRFEGREICILHVHQPSSLIPTLLGKLPATQANPDVVRSHRILEREQMEKLLFDYMSICAQSKVKACVVTAENDHVRKGIVDLLNKFCVKMLVMGAVPENWMKLKSSSKSSYIAKNAPSFCQIWFVNKGQLLYTRGTAESSDSLPQSIHRDSNNLRSQSLRYFKSEVGLHQEYCRSSSVTRFSDGTVSRVQTKEGQGDSLANKTSLPYFYNLSSATSSDSGYSSSAERVSSYSNLEEESLCRQLEEVNMEAEASRNEAFQELLKRKRLEAKALEANRKIKAYESAHAREVELRKVSEDTLKVAMQEQEQLLEQREMVTNELRKARRNIAILDSQVKEANHRREETAEELKLIQVSITTLKIEKQAVQRQKMEAANWLNRWKNRGQAGDAICVNEFSEDASSTARLAEFSLMDLQTATCNFSESFKIGHGGYGSVYKGEMLNRTVAIKKLHLNNMQGQSEFQQEVQVLGKLQHRHLLTLLGICPEACALVYEYMPNGSLESYLSHSSNSYSMNWKTRTRLIFEIANALLFLHSSKPEKIVHGNLKPENILLDSELSCKICDFRFSRLVNKETVRCHSFRQYTEPKGSFSFTDPEFPQNGILTTKSDIYSFGMVILWLLAGRNPAGLTSEVRKATSESKLVSVLNASAGEWPSFVARRLADLALQCCELNSRDRPVLTPTLVKELEQLHRFEDRQVPSFFLCPILQELMHDPQLAADGFTYEGEALRGWLENGRKTSPMTNLNLSHLNLIPNHSLRLAIQDWLCNP